MRYFFITLLTLQLANVHIGFAQAADEANTDSYPILPGKPVAFVNGMLLDGYEAEPIHDAVVVIDGKRIVAAGPRHKTPIPDNAHVIDIGGKTLMPGFIDAHVHLDLIGHGDYDRYYRFLGGMQRLGEVMPIAAKQMLRAGVTSAVDLGTPLEILEFRERVRDREIPGPRLIVSGPWLTRVYYAGVPDEYQIVVQSPREAAQRTRELIDAGVDVIKTWVGLTLEDYKAIVEVAHAADVKVHAHLYDPDAIRNAIDAGIDVFQHVGSARNPPYSDALINEIAHKNIPVVQTISHRIWVYPATVAFPARLRKPLYAKDMPADIHAEFMASFESFHTLEYFHDIGREIRNAAVAAKQFIEGGAYIGVGTDAASPMNMHDEAMRFEMEALVDSGMTPIEVISAATKTNAEILGLFDELGSVEAGKLADLVIVRGNPLANISNAGNVDIVVKDGVVHYAETADARELAGIGNAF